MTAEEYNNVVNMCKKERKAKMIRMLTTNDPEFKIAYKCNRTQIRLVNVKTGRFIVPYEYDSNAGAWVDNYRVYTVDNRLANGIDRLITSLDEAMQITRRDN